MRSPASRAIAAALVLGLSCGCSSSVALTVPPVAKQAPAELSRPPRARLGELTGAPCFREQVKYYLSSPGGLQLANEGGPFDLTLTGSATRIEVHSN